MTNRKKLIYDTLKDNPFGKLPTLSVAIKKETGTGVAIPKLMQLRAAMADGSFDSVYDALFAGEDTSAKPAPKKAGRSKRGHVSAPIHQGEAAPLGATSAPADHLGDASRAERSVGDGSGLPVTTQAKPSKVRGDRRGKSEPRGRRDSDLNKVQLNEFSEHLVVYRKDGVLQQATFKSRERAEKLVRDLLGGGCVATDIAYYRLNPIKTKVVVTV